MGLEVSCFHILGGVLKGPLLEMILNYNEKEATYIAYCFMFGGTLLNTVLLIFEK